MAEQTTVGIAETVAGSLICPIWQEFQYLLNYNSNVEKLEEKVKELECKKNAIQLQVDEAEGNTEIIGPDVQNWFEKFSKLKKEVDEVLEHINKAQIGCLFCECPNLYSRYILSKEASKMSSDVIELENAGKFDRVGYPTPPGRMPFTSPGEFDSFESRKMIMDDVLEALRDDSITTIGICGMGGVGKTTLVKEIAERVKATNLYDEVVMAVVSNDAIVANIQDQLAECLGLKIEKTTDYARANLLYKRLKENNKRVLIVLDDLWQELDFRSIGIPLPGELKGLKVVLTSRDKEVCDNMRAKTFQVDVLSKEESWDLFMRISEISKEVNGIKGIAKEVAKECGGLPLAIEVIGKALKKKKVHAWRNTLHQLKEASVTSIKGMHKLVYSRIKLSYDYIESVDSKKMLLLCPLFPEDHNILLEDLVRHANGLQLFENVETIAQVRDKVYSISDELINCCLLLQGADEKCVKLHDLVRDVCLSIASSEEHLYMVKHSGLNEWPQKESYASYTCISLTFGGEIRQLPSCLKCPNLKLLRLLFHWANIWVDMPEDFFKEMKQLEVLEVEYLNSKVPSSLQLLVNLRTLWFTQCKLDGDISVIQSLNKLEIFGLHSCYSESLSGNMMKVLKNLKFLDLRYMKCPPILLDFLGSLEKLEELFIDIACNLEEMSHGNLPRGSFTKLREVHLHNLSTLRHLWGDEVTFPNLERLKRLDVWNCMSLEVVFDFKGLNVEGSPHVQTPLLDCLQVLNLFDLDSLKHIWRMLPEGIQAFRNLRELHVEFCHNLRYLLSPSMAKVLVGLETLDIAFCSEMEAIIGMEEIAISENTLKKKNEDAEETANKIEFPKLTRLGVFSLNNLRMLCSENIDLELPSLIELEIDECPMQQD